MKKISVIISAILVATALLFWGCGTTDQPTVKWLSSMEEGKEKATSEKKHLLVYYSADWSKMSERFEDDVLDDATVEEKLAADFIAVHIDSDVDEETPVAYNVNAFPTTIFYTPTGEEVTRVVGAVPAEEFAKLVDDIVAGKVETLVQLLAREEANPDDLKLAYEIGTMYVETGRPEKARSRFDKVIAGDAENGTGLVPGALLQRGFIDLMAPNAEGAIPAFNEVIEKYPDSPEAVKCYLYLGDADHLLDDVEGAVEAYRHVVEAYPDSPEAEEAQRKLTKLTMFEDTVEAFAQGPETAAGEGK
ncbi:MAG: thioredoxin family protein [Candidatus Zixiibacteriota bacterium]|jgi:thioredoxin-like negative regulator of GroEL